MSNVNTQQNNSESIILTSREFYRSPAKVADIMQAGQSIAVTKRGERFFNVTPEPVNKKGLTMKDFSDLIIYNSGETDLSQRVDEIVYGNNAASRL